MLAASGVVPTGFAAGMAAAVGEAEAGREARIGVIPSITVDVRSASCEGAMATNDAGAVDAD